MRATMESPRRAPVNATVSQRVAIGLAVEAELARAGDRRGRPGKAETRVSQNFPFSGRTDCLAAERAGFGNKTTYRQARAVVAAAEEDPELYGGLVELMDRGSVPRAFRELQERRQGLAMLDEATQFAVRRRLASGAATTLRAALEQGGDDPPTSAATRRAQRELQRAELALQVDRLLGSLRRAAVKASAGDRRRHLRQLAAFRARLDALIQELEP